MAHMRVDKYRMYQPLIRAELVQTIVRAKPDGQSGDASSGHLTRPGKPVISARRR